MGRPSINNQGEVAFRADTVGTIPTSLEGIWSEGGGQMSLVAYERWSAPDTATGVMYSSFANPIINDVGRVSFTASLSGTGVTGANRETIYVQSPTGVHLVARSGMQAPGAPAGVLLGGVMTADTFNNSGYLNFSATLTSVSVPSGLFTQDIGSPRAVALGGNQAPGMPAGFNFASGHPISVINNSGTIAFFHRATNGTPQTRDGIWAERAGTLSLLGGQGMPAPGTGPGVTFSQFDGNLGINDNGTIVFSSWVTGNGVNSDNSRAIWIDRGQGEELLVRTGMVAPTTGSVFGSLEGPRIGGNEAVVFGASLSGFGLQGASFWESNAAGQLRLLVREGMAAPGTPAGSTFNLSNGYALAGPNRNGQIAIYASINGPGVDFNNNNGIWVVDPDGALRLVVREGDQIEIAPGVFRTIAASALVGDGWTSGGQDGRYRWFNDRGEVAFSCYFSDGSKGIFVASIPEPASIVLAIAAILLQLTRRSMPA